MNPFRRLAPGWASRRGRGNPPTAPALPTAPHDPAAPNVHGQQVLAAVTALPISTWRYQSDPPGLYHLGPMAQDWKAAFDFGQDDTSIPIVDAIGVLLVCVQALQHVQLNVCSHPAAASTDSCLADRRFTGQDETGT
jgi:hypothetical protein